MHDQDRLTLFITLVLTGIVCILMGCGIPTTATYIIMATIAAPILGLLGVQPIVAHFFVFYYGVLADITPPVALAAYAAAGMAGADPFKTGNTAFRLALGKALVPFVFVFSPSLLLVADGFSWVEFAIGLTGCLAGHRCAVRRVLRLFHRADERLGALARRPRRNAVRRTLTRRLARRPRHPCAGHPAAGAKRRHRSARDLINCAAMPSAHPLPTRL